MLAIDKRMYIYIYILDSSGISADKKEQKTFSLPLTLCRAQESFRGTTDCPSRRETCSSHWLHRLMSSATGQAPYPVRWWRLNCASIGFWRRPCAVSQTDLKMDGLVSNRSITIDPNRSQWIPIAQIHTHTHTHTYTHTHIHTHTYTHTYTHIYIYIYIHIYIHMYIHIKKYIYICV